MTFKIKVGKKKKRHPALLLPWFVSESKHGALLCSLGGLEPCWDPTPQTRSPPWGWGLLEVTAHC